MDVERVRAELQRFVAAKFGELYTVVRLRPAGGHAGLTFMFSLVKPGGATEDLVLRLPPPGVRRQGNTDVYRQAPLLRALSAAKLPVPRIRWAQADEHWFGLPFIIMERIPGEVFHPWEPDQSFDLKPQAVQSLWLEAAEILADLHHFDWRTELADWEPVRSLESEIRAWRPIYERAPESAWLRLAGELEALLLQSIPERPQIGLFHGDYQPANILYQNGRAVGVIDWELAGIGAQALDLGWLMMIVDPMMWKSDYRPWHAPSIEEIRAAYENSLGESVRDARWYEALAAYRFGSIACLNVKLHRKGQREDPMWDKIAPSIPSLFGHAQKILLEQQ